MLLYRSIGQLELNALMRGNRIFGMYNCAKEKQNDCNMENAVCFFTENIRWKDKRHLFLVEVDVPDSMIQFGTGIYYASRNFKKTHVWTGRRGKTMYKLKEAYVPYYDFSMVRKIDYDGFFQIEHMESLSSLQRMEQHSA